MSDQPDIVLNEFGDLSRRARRELLAQGIDPDTAVVEYLNTQSIPVQASVVHEPSFSDLIAGDDRQNESSQALTVATTSVSPVATVPWDGATTTAEVFPASMSKREISTFLNRDKSIETAEGSAPQLRLVEEVHNVVDTDAIEFAEVIQDSPVSDSPSREVASDSYPAYDEVDGVEDEFDAELDAGPTTISEATAAQALAEAIAAHNAARIDNGLELDAASAAALVEDFEQFSVGVSTTTGSIPTISNALILPTLPEDTGSIIPIATNTGEIMITESVSIPSSISQLGAHIESLDTSEVDVIANDQDITPTDALAPVSATTAVSSYNLNNAVVTVPRRVSDRLPLVLSLTAAGLAVAVVALFVAGYFLGIF